MEMTIGIRRRIAKQTQRRAELTPETMIVALDLGKRRHAVWVTDSTRIPMETWMMPATPQGFATLFERTARLQQQFERPHVLFAMEPTSHFWKLAAQQIMDRGAHYRLVQPLSVRRAREEQRYTWAKGDRMDAESDRYAYRERDLAGEAAGDGTVGDLGTGGPHTAPLGAAAGRYLAGTPGVDRALLSQLSILA